MLRRSRHIWAALHPTHLKRRMWLLRLDLHLTYLRLFFLSSEDEARAWILNWVPRVDLSEILQTAHSCRITPCPQGPRSQSGHRFPRLFPWTQCPVPHCRQRCEKLPCSHLPKLQGPHRRLSCRVHLGGEGPRSVPHSWQLKDQLPCSHRPELAGRFFAIVTPIPPPTQAPEGSPAVPQSERMWCAVLPRK